jgi:fatty acid desaturase
VPERRKGELVSEARFFVSLYISIAIWQLLMGYSFAWYYWVLPSLLGQPFLRFYLITEHTGCKDSLNLFENTRTTETNWFYKKLAWNMPYHAEHHAYPLVPFHALDQVHKLCHKYYSSNSPCTPSGSNGYISVNKGILSDLSPHTNNKTQ